MTKRRERIERWRAERKRKELEIQKSDKLSKLSLPIQTTKKWSLENESDDEDDSKDVVVITPSGSNSTITNNVNGTTSNNLSKTNNTNNEDNNIKIINIKSDGDEKMDVDEEEVEAKEEMDPLDAFMLEVHKEVRKVNKISKSNNSSNSNSNTTTSNSSSGGVMVVTGVSKNSNEIKKGEMMEQNQDGLEYSSEEELEDIKDTAANLANKHKKELAKIDHSGVDYMQFRKDFYVEVPELAKLTNDEIDAYKIELEGIQVKGKGCPKPLKVSEFYFL